MIAGSVASACVVVSECSVLAGAQHVTMEVVEAEICRYRMVPSACAVVSKCSVLAGVQHGTVMAEIDVAVGSETDVSVVVDVHTGTVPKIKEAPGAEWGMEAELKAVAVGYAETSTVAVGASAKRVTSAGSSVGQWKGKQAHVQLSTLIW